MEANRITSLTISAFAFVLIVTALYLIVNPFLEGFAWGVILVLITWPIFNWLKNSCRLSDHIAALILSLSLTALSLAILLPSALELGKELYALSNNRNMAAQSLLERLAKLPVLGSFFESQHLIETFKSFFEGLVEISIKALGHASQILISSLFNIAVMLLCSYFLYRYGKSLVAQSEAVLTYYAGKKCVRFFELIEKTIKGVVYGALLTALAQGMLAGIGFYFAGAPMPALFALATVIISFVPFGAPMVYVPLSVYLLLVSQNTYAAIGLLLYGISIVSTIDNIIRPIFISHAIQISVLLVFVGVVGGIFAFGLIGLFIGPVIIAVIQALWKDVVGNAYNSQKLLADSSN